MTDRDQMPDEWRPAREPFFNVPWLAVAIPVILITLYAVQWFASPNAQAQILDSFALTPTLLRTGLYELLLTHIFLHGSWLHVLANSAFCLAFATPLVRAMGRGAGGALSYIVFFLLCGAAGGFGYCLLNWYSSVPVVGASGAIAGLVGGAIRLRIEPGDPDMKPLWHPRVLTMTAVWVIMNVATVFVPMSVGEGMVVAWQAHIAGYLFGLILISPWMRLFHRHYFQTG